MEEQHKYQAFISYNWSGEKIAKKLQNQLEPYRFPKSIHKKNK